MLKNNLKREPKRNLKIPLFIVTKQQSTRAIDEMNRRGLRSSTRRQTKASSSLRPQTTTRRAPSTTQTRPKLKPCPSKMRQTKAPSSLRSGTTEQTKLKWLQEKLLLAKIEKTNRPFQAFNLQQACNSEPEIFGESGPGLRRLFQYRFKYLKKLSIDKYVNFLKKHEENPSATTQRLLLKATTSQGSGKRVAKKFGKTGMRVAKVSRSDDEVAEVEAVAVAVDEECETEEEDEVMAQVVSPNTNSRSAAERIGELAQLLKTGMVTKKQYEKKKEAIINSI
jgi:ribosomal protein L39E